MLDCPICAPGNIEHRDIRGTGVTERYVLFECWIHGNRTDPETPPCSDPHPMTERPTVAEMAAVEAHRNATRICGAICPCGPNGEPLACAFPPVLPGEPMHDHSWATLPTFTQPDAVTDPFEEKVSDRTQQLVGLGERHPEERP